MDFEPEYWLKLAQEDPQEFERARLQVIEDLIASAPPAMQDRLRGLQCRIDLERRKAKTPLGAAIRLQSLMWDRFESLRAALNDLRDMDLQAEPPARRPAPCAEVIPFTRARREESEQDAGSRPPG
ncbi:MAG: DUF3135 domain-containing protein [Burkholderiales bacterium]|nr:DUF3135 domain-containing protein [Burkholderiales bacterium]